MTLEVQYFNSPSGDNIEAAVSVPVVPSGATLDSGHGSSHRVRLARDWRDVVSARRLWYSVYVEEMGRHRSDADHSIRTLADPRDSHGHLILVADARGETIGTALCTLCREGPIDDYEALYEMRKLSPHHPLRTSIGTKLIIAQAHRRAGTVFGLLMRSAFCLGMMNGIRYNVIDCRSPMLAVFRRMGFRPHVPNILHPLYGPAHCLAIDLEDRGSLVDLQSPFLPVLDFWRGIRGPGDYRVEALFRNLGREM